MYSSSFHCNIMRTAKQISPGVPYLWKVTVNGVSIHSVQVRWRRLVVLQPRIESDVEAISAGGNFALHPRFAFDCRRKSAKRKAAKALVVLVFFSRISSTTKNELTRILK